METMTYFEIDFIHSIHITYVRAGSTGLCALKKGAYLEFFFEQPPAKKLCVISDDTNYPLMTRDVTPRELISSGT